MSKSFSQPKIKKHKKSF